MRIFHITKKVILPSLIIFFLGCASHQKQALSKIQVGMDKADVLEKIGSPTRKARIFGQDRWTYELDSSSGATTTYVFFQEGKVTYIGGAEEPADAATKKTKPAGQFKPIGE